MYMPSLGDLVRVKGKVVTYCGQQQLTVTCCGARLRTRVTSALRSAPSLTPRRGKWPEPVTDANEELLHWLDAAALAEHG
jgi:predicted extracellular nuclease